MNFQKLQEAKKRCGFILIQTTEKEALKDMSFHLQTRARLNPLTNDKQKSIEDSSASLSKGDLPAVYNSSQSCFLVNVKNEPFIVTSGAILTTILSEQAKQSFQRDLSLSLSTINLDARFHMSLEDSTEQFIELTPHKLAIDEDVMEFFQEIKQKSFSYRNQATIQNFSFDQDIIKNTSVLFLRVKDETIRTQILNRITSSKLDYSDKIPSQGESISTISSPFGILSSELYLNILGQGIQINTHTLFSLLVTPIREEVEKHILMIDMTNYGGKEGGIILDQKQNLVGILLPSFGYQGANPVYFTFAISVKTIIGLAQDSPKEITESDTALISTQDEENKSQMSSNICLIKTSYGHFTGMVVNKSGYIISVRHGIDSIQSQPIYAYLPGFGAAFEVELICVSEGDYDISLFRIKGDLTSLQINELPLYQPNQLGELNIGQPVFSVGYGVIHPSRMPQISSGNVSKVIKTVEGSSVLLQTDTRIQNGCSGGAMFHRKYVVGMVLFNLKHVNLGNICDLNFALHYSVLQPLFSAISEHKTEPFIKQLSIWKFRQDQVRSFNSLQTTEQVPQYTLFPNL